ncbi:MAG TPA: AraC family transcriptional regulator [Pyrinomonadaceae bacterium]|nr:AraC family transcriptional regulator [Pyrinomonadaceae bacterium]
MDVLSDILKVIKLDGALFFNAEFSAPWCLYSRLTKEVAQALSPSAGHLIIYHFLREGRAYAKLADGRQEELTAGDIVIFPHGDPHYLGNGRPAKPVDSFKTFAKNLTEGLRVAHFGGGGEVTRFVCGFMGCEPRLSEVFLAALPPIMKVRIGNEPSGQWIENSIRFSVGEADGSNAVNESSNAGSALVHAKLSEVLFVETLRRYISSLPADQVGWLAGARDPLVGQALALLHKDPARPWTISELARGVGLSRTRLSERFRRFLGESPMAYLVRWRLKLAADILQSSDDSIWQVASAVGYGSEASFNRAFKREYASPPAQFRRRHRQ